MNEDLKAITPEDLSADDFEFSDPEYSHLEATTRAYDLQASSGQQALMGDLARHSGVQTIVLSNLQGQVITERGPKGAASIGSVVAATALLFRGRGLRLISAQFGGATVVMRVIGEYCVAIVAKGNVNVGRLLTELQQIEAA